MITLITGLPGSGKSLFTLKTIKDMADKEMRPVFYHGIPELTLDWQKMQKGEDWVDCPQGAIIVIDECQGTFRPRANGAAVPKCVSQLEVHRHSGHDLFLITQHPMLLDGNVRRLVGRHFHVVRFYGFQKSTIHEFQSVRENVKSLKGSIEKHFVYPKEVFGWYKSADLHTVKKRIPARLVLVVLMPILFVLVAWYAIKTINGFTDHHTPENLEVQTEKVINPTAQPYAPARQYVKEEPTWLEARQERVPGLPYTAPVYDKLTEPITVPVPAACVDFRGQCKCYSQQGTPVATPEYLCKQIIQGGMFVDFNPGQSANDLSQQAERERVTADRQRSEEARQRTLERQDAELEKRNANPVQQAQTPDQVQQQPIQPSAIQRERMKESQWAFPNT